MDNDRINRIIGVVIIFAIIFFGLFWFSGMKLNKVSTTPTPSGPVNKIENFSDNKISPDFPKQIPIETGAKIISSYNATSPDDRVQASVVFQSSKSVATNYKLYTDYLAKNDWKIIAQSSTTDTKTIIAQNSTGIINVTIHQTTDQNKSLVDLSFLVNK